MAKFTEEQTEMAKLFGHKPDEIYSKKKKALNDGEAIPEEETTAEKDLEQSAEETVPLADVVAKERGMNVEQTEKLRKRLLSAIFKFNETQNSQGVKKALQQASAAIENAETVDEIKRIWLELTKKYNISLSKATQKAFADDEISDDELEAMLSAEMDNYNEDTTEEGTPIVPVEGEEETIVEEEEPMEEENEKSEIDTLIEDLQALIDNEELELNEEATTEIEETIAGLEETRGAIATAKEVLEKNAPEVGIEEEVPVEEEIE